jgi:CRP/FNR family transcriptional regulator, cyclic AMP receptor protein
VRKCVRSQDAIGCICSVRTKRAQAYTDRRAFPLRARRGTMPPTRIELLQHMPIFGAIREDMLRLLLGHAREVAVRTGAFFFREHDPASSMFVLEAGRVAVLKSAPRPTSTSSAPQGGMSKVAAPHSLMSWESRDLVLHTLNAGDCFGEMALMDLFPRSASVRAEEDCRAIEFGAADLLHLFEHDAEQFALIQMNIGREVCRRLRATDELLFRARMGA